MRRGDQYHSDICQFITKLKPGINQLNLAKQNSEEKQNREFFFFLKKSLEDVGFMVLWFCLFQFCLWALVNSGETGKHCVFNRINVGWLHNTMTEHDTGCWRAASVCLAHGSVPCRAHPSGWTNSNPNTFFLEMLSDQSGANAGAVKFCWGLLFGFISAVIITWPIHSTRWEQSGSCKISSESAVLAHMSS